MNPKRYYTANFATPHPDDEGEPAPITMAEAVALAVKVLRNPNAESAHRCMAANSLTEALENQREQVNELLDLCRRSLRALDEDSYPQLRDDLWDGIDKAEKATS